MDRFALRSMDIRRGVVGNAFAPSMVRSIQRGTLGINGASGSLAINAVDLTQSLIRLVGRTASGPNSAANEVGFGRLELTSAALVSGYRASASASDTTYFSFEVIEFLPGILRNVQRGATTFTGTGSGYSMFNPVASLDRTELSSLGIVDAGLIGQLYNDVLLAMHSVSNLYASSGATNSQVFGWQIVEWW